MSWLTCKERIVKKIAAGTFGKCGKMVINPYSIPEELKSKYLKIFNKYITISICGCWEWKGRIHNGYGVFPCPGSSSRWAHRVSYALFKGPISGGMHIDHTCRNRKCVRPDHLEQKTPIENYRAIFTRKYLDDKKLKEEKGQLTLW